MCYLDLVDDSETLLVSTNKWTKPQLQGFQNAAQSLKLYRRAELQDEDDGTSLIETLYVDPLPNEHVYETMIRPNTTFIVGRKGTGKSTVFQRAQHELRKKSGCVSVYVDIKTVFESSQVDPTLLDVATSGIGALPKDTIGKLLLYRSFMEAVIAEIQSELKQRVKRNIWEQIKNAVAGSIDELFEGLDALLEDAGQDQFISVLGVKQASLQTKDQKQFKTATEQNDSLTLSKAPELKTSDKATNELSGTNEENIQYADVLMRVFNIKEYLLRLKVLLKSISVRHLHIFVDDFSELPEDAMRLVVDSLLAPLNNWSEELVKFKVAAYPGRVYYGSIDKTKIDEINLDMYSLYGTSDVGEMESKAVDFTKRLVDRRLKHYCKCNASVFMEIDRDDIWKLLFYATMGNPRNLGYVLYYLHESHLIYGRAIGIQAVRDAAQRYYTEKIEPYFSMNKFLHESFSERSSTYSLKELLEALVQRARELRNYRGSAVFRDIVGRPPTSHFHIAKSLDALLSTLELNFFVTKYYEMKDRDGRDVSVFALNYGLCQKYTIEFGRPVGKREFRLYFVERIFDYSSNLREYMQVNQEIVCTRCDERFELEVLPALKLYGMQCPRCRNGICEVTNLSKKYESILRSVDAELLLPKTELGILQTLHTEKQSLSAGEIAAELDCSYQLVGKRAKFLSERGLVTRDQWEQSRRQFQITDSAERTYFGSDVADELDLVS